MSEGAFARFWKRRVRDPLVAQLTQGVTPRHLALSCALGSVLGIFPILGTTTLLCLLVGIFLKLNQPAIQSVNYLVYPLQLTLFPIFVKAGEKLFRADPITFSPLQLTKEFAQGPLLFLEKYGAAGFHGIVVWMIVAPVLTAAIYFSLVPIFKGMTGTLRTHPIFKGEQHD